MIRNYLSVGKKSKSLLAMTIDSIKKDSKTNLFSTLTENDIFPEEIKSKTKSRIMLTQKDDKKIKTVKYLRNQRLKTSKSTLTHYKSKHKKELIEPQEDTVRKGKYIINI